MAQLSRRALLTGALSTAIPLPSFAVGNSGIATFRAIDFVDSIGVNTHLSSEPYLSRFETVKRLVSELGVRHLRDELRPTNNLARWKELYDRYGVKSHMLVSPSTNSVVEMLAYIGKLGREKISAIEGQNEGDADWFMAHKSARGNWSKTVVDYQREVFQALRGRYGDDLPLVSPSVINWKPNDVFLLREAAPYSDYVAIHSYPQHAEEPETSADFAAVSWYLKHMRDSFKPGAPVMATETGYNTSTKPGASGVSEKAASIYLPRMLLDHFSKGIQRTFLYQLLDGGDDPGNWEHHYGLVRHDDTPKPSFTAISSMIRALRERDGDTPALGRTMQLTLQKVPEAIRYVVFTHADGSVTAAFWQAVLCWDREKAEDIEAAPAEVTLSADTPCESAQMLVPNEGSNWRTVEMQGAGQMTIPVSGKVALVRLTPRA